MGVTAHPFCTRGDSTGYPVTLIAGGPSVRGQLPILERAARRGIPCIGVNLAAFRIEFCTGAVILDWERIPETEKQRWASEKGRLAAGFRSPIFTEAGRIDRPVPNLYPVGVRSDGSFGLSDTIDCLFANGGGAGLAISVAWALGADPIILAGFDYVDTGDRYPYWFGGSCPNVEPFRAMREGLSSLSELTGDVVVNCSPISTLQGFPRRDLEHVLSELH